MKMKVEGSLSGVLAPDSEDAIKRSAILMKKDLSAAAVAWSSSPEMLAMLPWVLWERAWALPSVGPPSLWGLPRRWSADLLHRFLDGRSVRVSIG